MRYQATLIDKTKAVVLLLSAWTVLGFTYFFSLVLTYQLETRSPAGKKITSGQVTQIENKSGISPWGTPLKRIAVTVKFSPQPGKTLETTDHLDNLKLHGSHKRLSRGDPVPVVYDPAKPQKAYIWLASRNMPLLVFVVVVLPGIICFGVLQSIGLKFLSDDGEI
ncbi:MAG: DUF3592 domain-containing protein [Cyanophyceae cyanobacterium]